MQTTYSPADIEQKWYQFWEENGYFHTDIQSPAPSYAILLPPPNVTGTLHMGHAFQQTLMDLMIRHRRMAGDNVLWQAGTDHAGIATQMLVERQLNAKGIDRRDLERDAFLEHVWEWKRQSGDGISQQMRRLGASPDWSRALFTMDEAPSRAVTEAFVRLYREGKLYRGKRLVNWDPALKTALSDVEVENRDEKGKLWYFRYPLADKTMTQDGLAYIVIATTRPETMLGDSAVAINPQDARFADLIGKYVELPLIGRRIPIVGDDYVDPEFGTGCVKITPAHDFNDYEVGKRHNLPLINVMSAAADILPQAQVFDYQGNTIENCDCQLPSQYHHLSRQQARKKVIAEFESLGLLEKVEKHALKAPYGDRSGVIIEPLLTDQWFVRTSELAQPAIRAVEEGRIQFVPEQYQNMYFSWMRDIQDWCISRQLWWGHRIPAWYDIEGNSYVGRDEDEVRAFYELPADLKLKQDEDVLDTWFSSALWPMSTLGWPNVVDNQALAKWYPSDVLVTGFDIIFFWVARMVMMGMHFMEGEVPFKTVYMTGLVRDEHGQKMSKSKGNVIDPLDLIDGISLEDLLTKRTSALMLPKQAEQIKKATIASFPNGIDASGTDALRFTLASLASTGRNINFDRQRLEGYRNFCNKLWNASRYVLLNTADFDCGQNAATAYTLSISERYIIARLQQLAASTARHFDSYRFDLACKELYEFIWNEYCDWYIELAKVTLNNPQSDAPSMIGTRRTLVRVLEAALRLIHPVMPFISEELWQQIKDLAGASGQSISRCPYPKADENAIDQDALNAIGKVQEMVLAVRRIRAELNIAPSKPLTLLVKNPSEFDRQILNAHQNLIGSIAKLNQIELIDDEGEQSCASARLGEMTLLIPLAGLIDKTAELARLNKELQRQRQEVARLEGKLGNANFTARAPADIVQAERDKLATAQLQLVNLEAEINKINKL